MLVNVNDTGMMLHRGLYITLARPPSDMTSLRIDWSIILYEHGGTFASSSLDDLFNKFLAEGRVDADYDILTRGEPEDKVFILPGEFLDTRKQL